MKWTILIALGLITQKCNQMDSQASKQMKGSVLDVQGHRGCRGLMPENSIPGFLKALELGVTTLELDVVISSDLEVVVSHEPYFSHVICKDPLGREIGEQEEESHNIFQMNLSDVQQYDCGTKVHPGFPAQLKIKTYKPTLSEVFDHVENWLSEDMSEKVKYNIEIKRNPKHDHHFHPPANEFVPLVLEVIHAANLESRVNIQSFDIECLEVTHKLAPTIRLAYLVFEGNYRENMSLLSFKPDIYSPHFELVDDDLIKNVRADKIKIIPWTVNETEDITEMIRFGIDGIISDYPDRVFAVLRGGKS